MIERYWEKFNEWYGAWHVWRLKEDMDNATQ